MINFIIDFFFKNYNVQFHLTNAQVLVREKTILKYVIA